MGLQYMVSGPRSAARALLAAALLVAAPQVPAETLRCASGVIRLGDDQAVVLARCGPPASRSLRSKEIKATNHIGMPVVRVTQVESWVYDRGEGRFLQILDFDGGVLVSIQRGPRSGG